MVISSWIVTLGAGPGPRRTTTQALAAMPELTLGRPQASGRLPVAAETVDNRAALHLLDAIQALPGVQHVDIVAVYQADDEDAEAWDAEAWDAEARRA